MMYLASPYTHRIPSVQEWRFNAVTAAVAELVNFHVEVFSPIVYTHPISKMIPDVMNTLKFWMDIDEGFMDRCDQLGMLALPGWLESKGMLQEFKYMRLGQGKPWHVIDPEALGIYTMVGMPPETWRGEETDLWLRT